MSTLGIFTGMKEPGRYRFQVEFMRDALVFLESLDGKTQEKVLENIRVARFRNDPKLLKKIDKDIWEFRTSFNSQQIRLLAFWDKQSISFVVCTHGFIKKTKKLPIRQLNRAKRIRTNYFKKN